MGSVSDYFANLSGAPPRRFLAIAFLIAVAAAANLDGVVNSFDFFALAANFGKTSNVSWASGDFNFDGIVNALDFNALATNYGASASPSDPISASIANTADTFGSTLRFQAIIPEPAALFKASPTTNGDNVLSSLFSRDPISMDMFDDFPINRDHRLSDATELL